MGHSSTVENVLHLLYAMEKILLAEGYTVEPGIGITAASQTLRKISASG